MYKNSAADEASISGLLKNYTVIAVLLTTLCLTFLPISVFADTAAAEDGGESVGESYFVSSTVMDEIERKRLNSMPWFNKNCRGFIKDENVESADSDKGKNSVSNKKRIYADEFMVPDDVRESSVALNTGGAGLNLYIPGDSEPDLVSEVLDTLSDKIYYSKYKNKGKSERASGKGIKIFDSVTVGGYSVDLKDITLSDIRKKDSFLYEKRHEQFPWIAEEKVPDIFEEKLKDKEKALSIADVPLPVPENSEVITPAEKGYLIIKGDTESFMEDGRNTDYNSGQEYLESKKMLLVETILAGGVPESIGDFGRNKLTYICKTGLPVFFLNRNIGFLPAGGVEIHAFRPQIGIEVKYDAVKKYYRFYGKPFISVLPMSQIDTGIIILDGGQNTGQ